jgi:sialate O-acetylesterase
MGTIDDVDEVFVNGQLVGYSGVFPVLVETAYNVPRKYPIPVELLNQNGDNVIAVRVYDEYMDGGIRSGRIGLYYDQETSYLSQDLSGYWKFETVRKSKNEQKPVYHKKQDEIFVPGFWESLGYNGYDGNAIYEKSFTLNNEIDLDSELYLVLGYIDDQDEVFLNEKKIGDVEDINKGNRNYYRIFRGYEIPEGLLRKNGTNTLVINVYDQGELGGIYQGPIGIATEENFKKLKKNQKEPPSNYWDDFFKTIFE